MLKFILRVIVTSISLTPFFACNNDANEIQTTFLPNTSNLNLTYTVNKILPHDTGAYTQGLVKEDGFIYESTGLYGRSSLRKINEKTNRLEKIIKIKDNLIFAEGITIFGKKIYQLTWKNNIVYVYDKNTFTLKNKFNWPYEGWGITNNNKELIISTGSDNLYFVDPNSFSIKKVVKVRYKSGQVVDNLNELEYINGAVFANKYLTDTIFKINPNTGFVLGYINLKDILIRSGVLFDQSNFSAETGNVLNGIACDSVNNSFLITGKLWPVFIELKLKE